MSTSIGILKLRMLPVYYLLINQYLKTIIYTLLFPPTLHPHFLITTLVIHLCDLTNIAPSTPPLGMIHGYKWTLNIHA